MPSKNKATLAKEQETSVSNATESTQLPNVSKEKPSQDWFKESVTLIASILGISLALVGLLGASFIAFGRIYSWGYFESLNIPTFFLNFSEAEYADVGWFYPIMGLLILIGGVLNLVFVNKLSKFLVDISREKFEKSMVKLIERFTHKQLLFLKRLIQTIDNAIPILVYLVVAVIPIPLLVFFMIGVVSSQSELGKRVGFIFVVNFSENIELMSSQILGSDLTPLSCQMASNANCFLYKDLYLLTHNNGKYFLYQTIGSDCRPEKIYIIPDEYVISTKLTPTNHAKAPNNCLTQFAPSPTLQSSMPLLSTSTPTPIVVISTPSPIPTTP